MKKKEKVSKKKGKGWIALRETRADLEYYEESVYLGIQKEIGFARIKGFSQGRIDEDILDLNKTKSTFTRVVDTYDEQGRTYIVAEYSNDGSLFSYVNRLKANSMALK
jgi:hypothetical protein